MYASCSSTKNTKNEFEGTISSPNYPSKYRNSKSCTWKLTGPVGEKLKLDSFTYDIEKEDACKYDSLRIYDGKSTSYNRIAQLCGNKTYHSLTSSSNTLYIEFITDRSGVYGGFEIPYSIDGTIMFLIYDFFETSL